MVCLSEVSTQYNVQMMYRRNVHLKPNELINQCHPNTFNEKTNHKKPQNNVRGGTVDGGVDVTGS